MAPSHGTSSVRLCEAAFRFHRLLSGSRCMASLTSCRCFAERKYSTLKQHESKLRENFVKAAETVEFLNPPGERSPEPTKEQMKALETKLGHSFTNISLLKLALTHRSAAVPNSEVLAWIGDSCLELVVSEHLLAELGCTTPGALTIKRSKHTSRSCFTAFARELQLEQLIMMGKSILKTKQGPTNDMLAECFEAVFASIYIDGGIEAVREAYLKNFAK